MDGQGHAPAVLRQGKRLCTRFTGGLCGTKGRSTSLVPQAVRGDRRGCFIWCRCTLLRYIASLGEWDMSTEQLWNEVNTEGLREKIVPELFALWQIPHELIWDRAQATEVRGDTLHRQLSPLRIMWLLQMVRYATRCSPHAQYCNARYSSRTQTNEHEKWIIDQQFISWGRRKTFRY